MTYRSPLAFVLFVLVVALAWALDAPAIAGSPDFPLLLGVAAAAPGRVAFGWNRKREPMKTFTNVAASSTCYSMLPRYPRTLLGMVLQLGGTTFTKALVSRIELFLGEKSIWGPITGTQLDNIDQYLNGGQAGARSDYHIPIDFTFPNVKEIGGEFLGGIDMTTLPEGQLRLEVDIGAATAPTLVGHAIWGAPQNQAQLGPLMKKLVRRTYPQAPAGDFYPEVNLRGSILCREYWFSAVATAGVSAARGIGGGANTGTGVTGTVTVSARTPTGRYRITLGTPAANAGTFYLFDPRGRLIDSGTVAVAFSAGGLAFTMTDATDFVAGDGFTVDVLPLNTDQNINEVEIRKNEDYWWKRSDRAARFEQERFGRQPLSQLFVADFLLDNHIDSVLDTLNAATLDHRLNVTAAETPVLVAEVLAPPVTN